MKRIVSALLAAGATILATGAAHAAPNWLATVDPAGPGHRIGNPQAKVKLTEYISYTCTHCGDFAAQATSALDLYVATGKVQVDVRNFVRDPVDLTAALLANCGPAAKFRQNHAALILSQPKWFPLIGRATAAQRARWTTGTDAARRRAIASDLGFYTIMERRGYDRVASDRCLADNVLARRLAEQTAVAEKDPGVPGTPSFVLNGVLLTGTYSWDVLRPQIDARL